MNAIYDVFVLTLLVALLLHVYLQYRECRLRSPLPMHLDALKAEPAEELSSLGPFRV